MEGFLDAGMDVPRCTEPRMTGLAVHSLGDEGRMEGSENQDGTSCSKAMLLPYFATLASNDQ